MARATPLTVVPGGDLVAGGKTDLDRGIESASALLVSIGAPRLRRPGFDVTRAITEQEHRLYALLASTDPDTAHERYNTFIRRLVSFERAAEEAFGP